MKIAHILKSSDFNDVVTRGKRAGGELFSVYSLTSPKGEDAKVGIIISKKTEKSAVKRNYIRRLIYAFFREAKSIKKKTYIVVRMVRPLGKTKRREIKNKVWGELEGTTKRARIT